MGYMLSILDAEEPINTVYVLAASFDHQNNHFILVSRNEDSRLNTFVQYTDAIDNNEWLSLSNEHYLEVTNSEEGTVPERSLILIPRCIQIASIVLFLSPRFSLRMTMTA